MTALEYRRIASIMFSPSPSPKSLLTLSIPVLRFTSSLSFYMMVESTNLFFVAFKTRTLFFLSVASIASRLLGSSSSARNCYLCSCLIFRLIFFLLFLNPLTLKTRTMCYFWHYSYYYL